MITINIVGLRDGNHPFNIETDVSKIPEIASEFIGTVHTEGVLRKVSSRYSLVADVSGTARLVCDRSLEEYDEPISAVIDLDFVVDHDLAAQQRGRISELDDEEVRGIREEDKVIDLTEDVRQVLTVAIPFRRVAPAYRDIELEEIHPVIKGNDADETVEPEMVDDRWAALAKLKRQ